MFGFENRAFYLYGPRKNNLSCMTLFFERMAPKQNSLLSIVFRPFLALDELTVLRVK
jgi:hypothetical protein